MTKIETWFDNDQIKEAILGKDVYFVPDHTYRSEHDLLTIFTRLESWVTTDEKKAQASLAFYDCLSDYMDTDNIENAMSLIRTYLIHKEFGGSDILDINELIDKTKEMIKTYRSVVTDEYIAEFEHLTRNISNIKP